MPKHQLTELQISEISLVDRPGNPGALVALTKRDGEEERMPERKTKWVDRMRDAFTEIGKSDSSAAKRQIVERVRRHAIKKAATTVGNPDLIEARLWQKLYSAPAPVVVDYDFRPIQKRDGPTWAPTEAEARIEELALRIQKRDACTFSGGRHARDGVIQERGFPQPQRGGANRQAPGERSIPGADHSEGYSR